MSQLIWILIEHVCLFCLCSETEGRIRLYVESVLKVELIQVYNVHNGNRIFDCELAMRAVLGVTSQNSTPKLRKLIPKSTYEYCNKSNLQMLLLAGSSLLHMKLVDNMIIILSQGH